jgi:hypothetical protein
LALGAREGERKGEGERQSERETGRGREREHESECVCEREAEPEPWVRSDGRRREEAPGGAGVRLWAREGQAAPPTHQVHFGTFEFIRTSIHYEYDFPWGMGDLSSERMLPAPTPWRRIVFMMNIRRD